jgi:AmiR/NasT family two-component response regulator
VSARESLTVLLADESRERLDSIASTVRELGHEVTARAITVREVAEAVAEQNPSVSLVAVHRDDEHALDLIEQIAAFAGGPVIAVLEEEDADFVRRAAERGIHAYAHAPSAASIESAIELATRLHAETEELGEKVGQLETALERRATIERAKGILMERHGLDDAAAWDLLRNHARSASRKAVDVARAVVDGHALLPRRP